MPLPTAFPRVQANASLNRQAPQHDDLSQHHVWRLSGSRFCQRLSQLILSTFPYFLSCVVEELGSEIGAIGPFNRTRIMIDKDLLE